MHVAIIQDGNRRYAKARGLEVGTGHRLGADTTERVLEWMNILGIRHVTFYAFSTENFNRSREEKTELMQLFIRKLEEVITDERVIKNKINLTVIGDRSLLDADVLARVNAAEEATRYYSNYYVHVALAYGGRNEIVTTAKKILEDVRAGRFSADEITPDLITKEMYPEVPMPPVDLIIRTGNDRRTSNFLPWLASGNEAAVCFCAPTWPEFRYVDMLRALRTYDQRMRE
jgi:tritrans,polycis-undecaprenyl-diphosphate synthase [geranylgeranyl-diphosphate specific]